MRRLLMRAIAGRLCGTLLVTICIAVTVPAQEGPTTGRISTINPQGKLKVRQRKGEAFAEATFGMIVRRGYRLDLEPGARATVKCADGKLHELIPGPQGCPCVTPEEGTIQDGSQIPNTRGADTTESLFPVIISPRKTLLLTTRPTLRWSPVIQSKPGATVTYTVRIENYTGTLWSRKVNSQSELKYPADEKPLTKGEEYKLVVETQTRKSTEEGDATLGFTVLTEAEAKKIEEAEAAVRALKLHPTQTQFFIADLYAARGLLSEAILKLTSVKSTLRELAVLRLLGDLYAAIGLHREAIFNYESALKLSHAASDLEGQALTLTSLAHSYQMLNKPDKAKEYRMKAIALYRKLGENITIEQLATPKQN